MNRLSPAEKYIARLNSASVAQRPRLLGFLKGQIHMKGDIVSPIWKGWTADRKVPRYARRQHLKALAF